MNTVKKNSYIFILVTGNIRIHHNISVKEIIIFFNFFVHKHNSYFPITLKAANRLVYVKIKICQMFLMH